MGVMDKNITVTFVDFRLYGVLYLAYRILYVPSGIVCDKEGIRWLLTVFIRTFRSRRITKAVASYPPSNMLLENQHLPLLSKRNAER